MEKNSKELDDRKIVTALDSLKSGEKSKMLATIFFPDRQTDPTDRRWSDKAVISYFPGDK